MGHQHAQQCERERNTDRGSSAICSCTGSTRTAIPCTPRSDTHVNDLKRSCPAVSHSCSLHSRPSSSMFFSSCEAGARHAQATVLCLVLCERKQGSARGARILGSMNPCCSVCACCMATGLAASAPCAVGMPMPMAWACCACSFQTTPSTSLPGPLQLWAATQRHTRCPIGYSRRQDLLAYTCLHAGARTLTHHKAS